MLASTVFVITLPEKTPFTATPPAPATLTIKARMLLSSSMGESSSAEVRSAALSDDTIQSGIELGAMSEAWSVTSPPAATIESLIVAVTEFVMTLPRAVT